MKMKTAQAVFRLTLFSLDIMIIFLVANHHMSTEDFDEPGQKCHNMVAHYLVFTHLTTQSIFPWIEYILARWMVYHTSFYHDMLIFHISSKAAPVTHDLMKAPRCGEWSLFKHSPSIPGCPSLLVYAGASKTFRSLCSLGLVLSSWLVTRYGYDFSIHILTTTFINCVFVILSLFNLLMPGMGVQYSLLHKSLQVAEKVSLQAPCIYQQLFNGISLLAYWHH